MFTRSSSARSLGDAADVAASGGGLLQGLRKTTLLAKMGRLGSSTSLSVESPTSSAAPLSSSPWLERQEVLDARTRYFLVLMKRFQEQDGSLRQLEAELGDMLLQIQVSWCLHVNHLVAISPDQRLVWLAWVYGYGRVVESVRGHDAYGGSVHSDVQVRPCIQQMSIAMA